MSDTVPISGEMMLQVMCRSGCTLIMTNLVIIQILRIQKHACFGKQSRINFSFKFASERSLEQSAEHEGEHHREQQKEQREHGAQHDAHGR